MRILKYTKKKKEIQYKSKKIYMRSRIKEWFIKFKIYSSNLLSKLKRHNNVISLFSNFKIYMKTMI